MEEEKTARLVVCCAAAVLSVIALSLVARSIAADYFVSRDIAAGAKPIEARCAHGESAKELCLVLAGR